MKFYIVRDEHNKQDRFSGSYALALMKECKRQGVPYDVVSEIVDKDAPNVVLYPNRPMPGKEYKDYNEMDDKVTRSELFFMFMQIATDKKFEQGFGNKQGKVCIYGAGENVGAPLAEWLEQTGVFDVKRVRSSTAESAKEAAVRECDYIVVATPYGKKFPYSLSGKTVFDVSGNVKDQEKICKTFYSSSDIGKKVVHTVVNNAKEALKKYWRPWDTQNLPEHINVNMAHITEPPCKHCGHWNPKAITDAKGEIAHVRCCMSDKMFDDFSCFDPAKG